MDRPERHLQEELSQVAAWLSEEGLPPDSAWDSQLRRLWRSFQATRSRLSSVTSDLDAQRSKHLAEMAEVRRSLEQIRIFTEHKDALAQGIQDENDRLREQLRQLISLQDSQINEVAKMLYQQGLTELIPSSPSEQVAYLLVERASLLEATETPERLARDGADAAVEEMKAQVLEPAAPQAESRILAGQVSSAKRECSRLERDLEEGSRRLAMAHTEIRHLTDELESAHLTQRAYEPELQAAQHEVQHLRQEVEKLKKYEMAELRKSTELNDRLDFEARALRNRISSLDAENSSLHLSVASQQEMVKCLESALAEQRSELQLLSEQSEARKANEVHWKQQQLDNQPCMKERERREAVTQHCGETQHSQAALEKQFPLIKKPERSQQGENDSFFKHPSERVTAEKDLGPRVQKAPANDHDSENNLLATQEKCEILKTEICETLRRLDNERSKHHETREKHKAKLCRSKQRFEEEMAWRNEKISNLERDLSLCCHSLAKEKELTRSITAENDKLLNERRNLLQQLEKEQHNRKDNYLTASLSKCRVDFLEMENKKLAKKVLHVSSQVAVLERSLQNRLLATSAESHRKQVTGG